MMHMEWMDDCLYRLYHCEKRTCSCGCTILRRGLTVVDYCLREEDQLMIVANFFVQVSALGNVSKVLKKINKQL